MANSRDIALELVDNGLVTADDMLLACLKYMSTDDVEDMLDSNEWSERFMGDIYEDDDGQPTWEQECADFGESYE